MTYIAEAELGTIRQRVSDRMEQDAKRCLGVPLAVLYDVAQDVSTKGRQSSRWVLTVDLVLPCGAKLCVRERDRMTYRVRTCFFHTCVWRAVAGRRWRMLVRHLIERYATDNGNDTWSPPTPTDWPKTSPEA